MYKEHKSFLPIEDNQKIWRFIDLAKFCDILETQSLFFIKPKYFTDPWEGHLPKKHFDESSYGDIPRDMMSFSISMAKEKMPNATRNDFAVNCWHINEFESEALWKKYSDRGIAIQTTFGKLKKSLGGDSNYEEFIGKVNYIDHNNDIVNIGNMFNHLLWKRKSFEYENELRAVIWQKADMGGKGCRDFENVKGQEIKVDLSLLIENIYTSPFEDGSWFNEVVSKLIKRYSYSFNCYKSHLMDKPCWPNE